MARFDKNAPYELVGGLPGATYIQNGRYFNNGGAEVELYRSGEGTEARTLARTIQNSNPNLTVADEIELAGTIDTPTSPKSMHWRHLKALVEGYGHVWKDRQTALLFLEGREPEREEAEQPVIVAEEN
jgi:hypothetical protein